MYTNLKPARTFSSMKPRIRVSSKGSLASSLRVSKGVQAARRGSWRHGASFTDTAAGRIDPKRSLGIGNSRRETPKPKPDTPNPTNSQPQTQLYHKMHKISAFLKAGGSSARPVPSTRPLPSSCDDLLRSRLPQTLQNPKPLNLRPCTDPYLVGLHYD